MKTSDSLGVRLVFSLIALITSLSVVLAGGAVLLERHIRLDSLFSSAETTADFTAHTLVYPVWNLITREIEVQLELTFRDVAVQGAVLKLIDVDQEDFTFYRNEEGEVSRGSPRPDPQGFVETRQVVFNGRPIATLDLYFTESYVMSRLRTEAMSIALIVLVVDGILALALFAILRREVFGPLERIERWASGLVFKGDTVPDLNHSEDYRGEIASLSRSISGMLGLLNERYETILSKEREYRSLFETSAVSIWELDFSAIRAEREALVFLCSDHDDPGGDESSARRLFDLVRIKSVNRITLEWLGLPSLGALQDRIGSLFYRDVVDLFLREIQSLCLRSEGVSGECQLRIPSGGVRNYMVCFATLEGYEDTWSRVVLSAVDITDRARAEAELVKALDQKDSLLKELFHRTRNSLQLISSMMYLRESGAPESVREELSGLRTRINTIALAHDKLYESGDLSGVPVAPYLRDLIGYILQSYGNETQRVRVEVEASEEIVLIDAAIPIGVVVCELVDNSLAYAFPENRTGVVLVRLERNESGTMELSVGDDGVGPGPRFDPRRDAGVGLDTVLAVGEGQLRATVHFDFSSGFLCTLSFATPRGGRRV